MNLLNIINIKYIKFFFDSKKIFFFVHLLFRLIKAIRLNLNQDLLDKILIKEIRGHQLSIDAKYDLIVIYNLLKKHEPLTILDLGSGTSTIIFAIYAKDMLKKNINVRVVSLEEDILYYEKTKYGLKAINDNIVELSLCSTTTKTIKEHHFINYNFRHEYAYDFIYIDGPVDNKNDINYICDDINIIPKKDNFVALLDYRLKTYDYLRKDKNYYCQFSLFNKSELIFKR